MTHAARALGIAALAALALGFGLRILAPLAETDGLGRWGVLAGLSLAFPLAALALAEPARPARTALWRCTVALCALSLVPPLLSVMGADLAGVPARMAQRVLALASPAALVVAGLAAAKARGQSVGALPLALGAAACAMVLGLAFTPPAGGSGAMSAFRVNTLLAMSFLLLAAYLYVVAAHAAPGLRLGAAVLVLAGAAVAVSSMQVAAARGVAPAVFNGAFFVYFVGLFVEHAGIALLAMAGGTQDAQRRAPEPAAPAA